MSGWIEASDMGNINCDTFCETKGMPVLISAPFNCYCSKAFNVKNHILCETVSFDQWYSTMDTADKYGITIYVHELCKFPFVKTLG